MVPASAVERWRRGARILALAALLSSFFLPAIRQRLGGARTWGSGPNWGPFLPGYVVFATAFDELLSIPAALATVALPVYLIRGLQGATGGYAKLVTSLGALQAFTGGIIVAATSEIGAAQLGIGYFLWLGSFVIASWACWLPQVGRVAPEAG